MNRSVMTFSAFLAISQTALGLSPAKVSTPLLETLLAWPSDSMISVIVHLENQADIAGIDQQLYETKASRALRHQIVIQALRDVAEKTQGDLLAALDDFKNQGRIEGYTAYWITNCVIVKGLPSVIDELSDRSDIQWLERNFRFKLIEPIPHKTNGRDQHLDQNRGVPPGIRAVNAPRVWYELGITGAGRLVANLDTGVDGTHPALSSRWRGLFAPASECWLDLVYNYTSPHDLYGHGTHVMGTMCGNSMTTNDSVGVAPNALWIATNPIDQNVGEELNNDAITAFQWFADPDGDPYTIEDVPDVIQNSWGVDDRWPGYEDCFNLWNNVIINCEAAGIVVVFSAGNEGPGAQTCRSPATVAIDSVTMFSVGAVDATNDTLPPYQIVDFSSRGPSDCPPYSAIKPEVCAPGVDVYSSIPNGEYDWYSGTSMAGPHVAGIVALMREALPDAEVRDIKSALMRTAHDYGPQGEDNTYGFGFVDAYEAVLRIATNRGFVQGLVQDDNAGEPISGAAVQVVEDHHSVRADAEGFYRISLVADSTWTLQYSAFGYYSQTLEVAVPAGDTLTRDVRLIATPAGTLQGWIIAGDSVPVSGATVSFPGVPLPSEQADSLGGFQTSIPGDTTYVVRISYFDATCDTSLFVPSNTVTQVTLFLNSPRSLPTAPDAYGYRSFDRLDFGTPAVFDWFEISPSLGGNGTIVELEGQDSSAFVAMPFPLFFYGEEFDSLTINENGWLSPGISHDHTFFNTPIPAWQGPSGTLAPFWDNLHDGSDGEICYFYDSLNCRFIVEYNNLQYLPPREAHLTFQAQIHCTEARSTPTGDCEVVYLYRRLDITNASTVGIEDPSEVMGLQLAWNGLLDANTWPISPGAAVRLTTRSMPNAYGSLSGQIVAHPAIPDLSEAMVRVGCREIRPDETGLFTADSLVTGLHRPEVWLNGYEVGRVEVAIGEDSTSETTLEIWRLDSPRDLEATRDDYRVLLLWRPPVSTQGSGHADAFLNYNIYRNALLIASPTDTFHQDSLPGSGTYDYFVVAQYEGGVSDSSNHAQIEYISSATEIAQPLPTRFELLPCFPNPFNPTTTISFAVPQPSRIRVVIYDILGREVARLADGFYSAGYHRVSWDAQGAGTGLYFVRLDAPSFHQIRKVLLIR